MSDNPSTQLVRARREPIFEGEPPREEDKLITRNTLGDGFGGNRGIDDEQKMPRDQTKRTRSYIQSKASNIDQEINQGRI